MAKWTLPPTGAGIVSSPNMKTFILERTGECRSYDCVNSMIVVAPSSKVARKVARSKAMDEGKDLWTDPKLSTCKQLKPKSFKHAAVVCVEGTNG